MAVRILGGVAGSAGAVLVEGGEEEVAFVEGVAVLDSEFDFVFVVGVEVGEGGLVALVEGIGFEEVEGGLGADIS